MSFCEDCGAPLTPGVLFCENCGARVTSQEFAPPYTDDELKSKGAPSQETGLIYTNSTLLASQPDAGFSKENFLSLINQFIEDAKTRGVFYELYDVCNDFSDSGKIEKHIELISKRYSKKPFTYLFIIGSSSVIPSAVWKNEACDSNSDKDVSGDLCYSTLNLKSPFAGMKYNFSRTIRTGRLPNCDFARYFENLKNGSGKPGEIKTFGLSAKVWQKETCDIYSHITSGNTVLTSPEYTKDNVGSVLPADANLFLYNLHGSNQTEYWYGQQGESYPEAVSPETFGAISKPYFLAVEACYGAAYEGRGSSKSVLLNSLSGRCISFLGSSRIAFGASEAPGSCADIISDFWLQKVRSGMSAGDSLEAARETLMNGDKSPETIKTLAEFSLYGDPSVRMNEALKQVQGDGAKVCHPELTSRHAELTGRNPELVSGSVTGSSSLLHISLPDIHMAVRREIAAVDQKIEEAIEEMVYSQHADLKGVKPVFYKTHGAVDMNAVFSGKSTLGPKIVNVRFSPAGEIKGMLESK